MGDSSKTTDQSQSSSTSPWAAAMPLVSNMLSKYGSQNTDVTGAQNSAIDNLLSSTQNLPNFTPQATSAVNSLFSSSNAPQVGMLQSAYGDQRANLAGIADPNNLDPYKTPGLSDAIATMTGDITKNIKGVYAGSGRDPSGAGSFAGSLGRGLTQGIAPMIAGQYNTNVGNLMSANNAMMTGASNTASGISGLNQTDLQNRLAGITAGSSIPGLATSGAMAKLGAANAAYGQPYANLAQLLQPSMALAGLGSNSTGNSHSVQTNQPSILDMINSGMTDAGKGLSAASSLMMLSDRRAKTDIAKVGKLHDGQDVYSYRYRGSPRTEIGLMAQEVERRDPGAVVEIGGLKHVNYGRALAPAARVGALAEAA